MGNNVSDTIQVASVAEMISYVNMRYGDRKGFQFIEDGDVKSVTYKEFAKDTAVFARKLARTWGDVKGRQFGILAGNGYAYMPAMFGILLAGGVVVLLNVEETWENLQYELDLTEMTCIFTDGQYEKKEKRLAEQYGHLLKDFAPWTEEVRAEAAAMSADEVIDFTGEWINDRDRLAMILFTSGTTGKNKGVMYAEKSFFSLISYAVKQCETAGSWMNSYVMRAILVSPMYHIAGPAQIMTWMALGYQINVSRGARYLYQDLKKMESDYTSAIVPMIMKAFAKDLKSGHKERLGGLKTISCGAATMDPDLFQEFEKEGIMTMQGYGMTEIFGGGTQNASRNMEKLASVGVPGIGCELKIEDGEVCLKSEGVMMGYYKNPEETAKTLKDGWLHTGDLGYLDEDGYLYLTGRKKNLIILANGENISPEELEGLLEKNPLIEETRVLEKDEKICAQIYIGRERNADNKEILNRLAAEAGLEPKTAVEALMEGCEQQVREFVRQTNNKLPSYKRIGLIEFLAEPLPRTASGKIKRAV